MDKNELGWLDAAITRALPIIRQIFAQYGPAGFQVEFTAGREWFKHGHSSLHHSGNAVDIRTRTLPDGGLGASSSHIATVLQQALDTKLGRGDYTVLLNDQGPHQPHIHVQFNKGGRWSQPGDGPFRVG
jgi:hypothetical protein